MNDGADEHREEVMKNQMDNQNSQTECRPNGGAFAFLVAGLGIGAALSVFLAPKSGAETRKWIATKCLDGIDSANMKVRETRVRVHEFVDEGQQKVSEAVTAGREAIGKEKPEAQVKPS
jgi:gas vesicle protein